MPNTIGFSPHPPKKARFWVQILTAVVSTAESCGAGWTLQRLQAAESTPRLFLCGRGGEPAQPQAPTLLALRSSLPWPSIPDPTQVTGDAGGALKGGMKVLTCK